MARLHRRSIAVMVVLLLAAAGCGNATGSSGSTTTAATGVPTDGGAANRSVHKAITGVPGVSDGEISYAVVGTKENNPLGICILDCYLAGVKAYFAYRNSQGGIYGRKLVVEQVDDDQLAQNQKVSLGIISDKKDFGTFQASLLPQGWGDLNDAGVPTYTWGVDSAAAANRDAVFPSTQLRCIDCVRQVLPYAAQQVGATRAGVLGYSTSQTSKTCADADAASFKRYAKDSGVQLAYLKDNVSFGLPNGLGTEVTAMKKAGVNFIATCFDFNAMQTLAQELKRQKMSNVVLYHPSSYDQVAVAKAGSLFDGDIVEVQFRPFQADVGGSSLGDFKTWMAKSHNPLTELAMVGWINASTAFDGLLAAGPSFDRAKVVAATNAMTHYTAGGLVSPVDWTTAHMTYTQATRANVTDTECAAFVKVVNGRFQTFGSKSKPWLCWPPGETKWVTPTPTNFN